MGCLDRVRAVVRPRTAAPTRHAANFPVTQPLFGRGFSLWLDRGRREAGFRKPLAKLRGLAAIYPNYVQLVVSEASGIKSLADLKGKRVSVGPKQSGTELNARAIFAAAGLSYSDFSRTDYLPFGQSAKLIEKGDLDATLQSAGLGVDSIRQLGTSVAIRLLEIPTETFWEQPR